MASILVVDDESGIQKLLISLFEDQGHNCTAVGHHKSGKRTGCFWILGCGVFWTSACLTDQVLKLCRLSVLV